MYIQFNGVDGRSVDVYIDYINMFMYLREVISKGIERQYDVLKVILRFWFGLWENVL